jgi:hypothetical protein
MRVLTWQFEAWEKSGDGQGHHPSGCGTERRDRFSTAGGHQLYNFKHNLPGEVFAAERGRQAA